MKCINCGLEIGLGPSVDSHMHCGTIGPAEILAVAIGKIHHGGHENPDELIVAEINKVIASERFRALTEAAEACKEPKHYNGVSAARKQAWKECELTILTIRDTKEGEG